MREFLRRALGVAGRFLRDDGARTGGSALPGGSSSGVALAEFAIAFPMQLFLTFGMIQLMLLMVSSLVVNYAAFRCCRAALVNYSDDTEATVKLVKPVAQVVLAPLGIASHRLTSVPNGWALDASSTAVTIPGWGDLRGSSATANKVRLEITEDEGVVRVQLSYLQELQLPFIDKLIAMLTHEPLKDGRGFAGQTESNGGAWVSPQGRVYLIVTRQHAMRRDALVNNVAMGSDVYQYKCDGW